MKIILFFLIILITFACNKPKTVFICGDHVCVNKAEAEQYFEDNLELEVKIIDKKGKKEVDLVELNLKSSSDGKKEISVLNKEQTKKKIKILSNDEIEMKKIELKKRKKDKKEKSKDKKITKQAKSKTKETQKSINNTRKSTDTVNKPTKKITDICTILEKCSIDEISKYLVKQGKKKEFPDISIREN